MPVRTWIARMGAFYERTGAARRRNNDGQTFNGGDLKVLAEFDVFSPDVWTFDASDRRWSRASRASIARRCGRRGRPPGPEPAGRSARSRTSTPTA
ncbi:MAG: hypothetical protein R3F43_19265 [bacterium]